MNRGNKITVILKPTPVAHQMGMDGPNKKSCEMTKIGSAVCPDCEIELIRIGTCFSCPVCGWGSCG